MKRSVCLFLLFLCVMLVACDGHMSEETLDPGTAGGITESSSEVSASAAVTAEDYYRYLNEVFLKDRDLVSDAPMDIHLPDGMKYASLLEKAGGIGLAAAFLEDFNGDGILEMLTVEIQQGEIQGSFYHYVMFEGGEAIDPEKRFVGFLVRHFVWEDGEIKEHGNGPITVMPDTSWGKMSIGLEKVGGEYFIFARVDGENMSTYGPEPILVSRIGGNALQPIYTSVLDFGRANASNYKQLLGIDNSLDIREYSLSDLKIPYSETEPEALREALGNRLLCLLDLDYVEFGGDRLVATVYDYTELHSNLADNGAHWKPIELPEGYRKELPVASDRLKDLAARVEAETGASLGEPAVTIEEDLCIAEYRTAKGNLLRLTWDTNADVLSGLAVNAYAFDPNEEWIALKDALLKQPEVAMSESDKETLLGHPGKLTDYMNGVVVGDYTVYFVWISNAVFRMALN